jgi:hypothetical protein
MAGATEAIGRSHDPPPDAPLLRRGAWHKVWFSMMIARSFDECRAYGAPRRALHRTRPAPKPRLCHLEETIRTCFFGCCLVDNALG